MNFTSSLCLSASDIAYWTFGWAKWKRTTKAEGHRMTSSAIAYKMWLFLSMETSCRRGPRARRRVRRVCGKTFPYAMQNCEEKNYLASDMGQGNVFVCLVPHCGTENAVLDGRVLSEWIQGGTKTTTAAAAKPQPQSWIDTWRWANWGTAPTVLSSLVNAKTPARRSPSSGWNGSTTPGRKPWIFGRLR